MEFVTFGAILEPHPLLITPEVAYFFFSTLWERWRCA
jgi:hypothetical protein